MVEMKRKSFVKRMVTALILGVILGVVVALIRVTWDKTCLEIRGPRRIVLAIANFAAKVYLTVIRGTRRLYRSAK